MRRKNLDYAPPEWLALAKEYEARGVDFPLEEVRLAVLGEPLKVKLGEGEVAIDARSRTILADREPSAEQLADLSRRMAALAPDTIRGQERAIFDLKVKTVSAWLRQSAADREGWQIPPDGEPKAKQVEGAENRPELYSQYLFRMVYNALRPAYDRAWPKYKGDRNTKTMREHIAAILTPLGIFDDLSPAVHKPIYRAIDYEIKRRKM